MILLKTGPTTQTIKPSFLVKGEHTIFKETHELRALEQHILAQ